MPSDAELVQLEARREQLRGEYLKPPASRAPTIGRGIHHAALICADVEHTIRFYQDLLGFPLVELVENRDYPGSSHFCFDLGNKTLLGFPSPSIMQEWESWASPQVRPLQNPVDHAEVGILPGRPQPTCPPVW